MSEGKIRGTARDVTARRALVEQAEPGVTADAGAVLARPPARDAARGAARRDSLPHPDSLTDQPSIRTVVSPDTDAATTTSVLADAGAATSSTRLPRSVDATASTRSARPLAWARRYVAIVAAC